MVFIGFQAQNQYSQAFSFFDLPKPKVFIGFQTQKRYSQPFSVFDHSKPKVCIGFQTQKQYSQAVSCTFQQHAITFSVSRPTTRIYKLIIQIKTQRGHSAQIPILIIFKILQIIWNLHPSRGTIK